MMTVGLQRRPAECRMQSADCRLAGKQKSSKGAKEQSGKTSARRAHNNWRPENLLTHANCASLLANQLASVLFCEFSTKRLLTATEQQRRGAN